MKYFKTPEGYAKTIHHSGFWVNSHTSITCDTDGKLREFYHSEYFTGEWKEIKLVKMPYSYAILLGVETEWEFANSKRMLKIQCIVLFCLVVGPLIGILFLNM